MRERWTCHKDSHMHSRYLMIIHQNRLLMHLPPVCIILCTAYSSNQILVVTYEFDLDQTFACDVQMPEYSLTTRLEQAHSELDRTTKKPNRIVF